MFHSISRSYALVCHSWNVLKRDKEIMIFPVLSALASLLVAASFIVPVVMYQMAHPSSGSTAQGGRQGEFEMQTAWYVYTFLFYVVSYFITIFFNVGVMHCAAKRMDGGDPTVADGFHGALSHIGSIFMWSLVSATVGMVLRAISERSGLIGRIVVSFLGIGWSLLTYFAVPVMIFEGVGAFDAIKRSGTLFKRTWGETVVGEAGMGLFFGLLAMIGLVPIGLAIFLAMQGTLGIGLGITLGASVLVYWIALGVISAALQGVFHVALYRYASTGRISGDYPQERIAAQWRAK
ncbi:MAG: hypothetical protein HUU15_14905 [Candidatus Brocadiae bacterium]|nr:hypothetical protein [Candidatus Brocadiia bacterium]